ncbi:MAG: glycosyltransferase family 2 protein [Bacteroidales bacterium]|nr:glycosyltransferase family 2 protein [Bacteroidales bacterium]
MEQPLMVSIRCLAYNHEAYIRQCLDGFVMQQTNFRFEAIVHDDASTDHTAEIIREYAAKYPDIIKPIYETENQYSKQDGSLRRIMNDACKGKYIAMCEGDDYWTDPLKLQKQVDFLEEHESYVMCAHNSIVKDESTGFMRCFNNWLTEDTFGYSEIISKNWFLPTQSLLFRRDVYERNITNRHFYNGDYYTQLCLTREGGLVHYSNECMGVYRAGVGISMNDTIYKNNLRLIELLKYMSALSNEKYKKVFENRIKEFRQSNEKIDIEEKNINSIWYKIRYKLLVIFIKMLRLKNPSVGIKIIH